MMLTDQSETRKGSESVSPSSGSGGVSEQSYGAKKGEEERLLIDLRSPGQEQGPWSEIRIGKEDVMVFHLYYGLGRQKPGMFGLH